MASLQEINEDCDIHNFPTVVKTILANAKKFRAGHLVQMVHASTNQYN